MPRSVPLYAFALTGLLLVCGLLSLVVGAMSLPVLDSLLIVVDKAFDANFSQLHDYQEVVVLELRLPRLLLAIFVGAILAQCGAVVQGLFRNPLADPGIIGVSSGAAVGAIVAIVLFPSAWGSWTIPVSAFLGGLLTTLLVYGFAQSKNGTSVLVLLLAGVAISAFAGAAIGFLSYFADDSSLRELSVWQMGSLTSASSANLWLAFTTMLVLMIAFQRRAQALNAVLLGESEARHLGINVEQLKLQMIILTAVGVGVAVSCAGIIGFIGLVVPHLVRLATGSNHHYLLPLSALLGAVLLMCSDLLARVVVQPAELPVGLVTVLLGAPFFLVLLVQQRKNWS
ncbi:iron ABC transporter permease [Amphritea sp. 2_MG-2023]|uniref:FecCD family ABC transporter permease n=1 Tax=Amphritea TaxID=515417 RepID=UPI001C078DED|nr:MULTISPECIES: iron ABC transporter permease [Amphritea]MBU2964262.1 iron ABC transporter permease [Amphritea atlantica]MDO6419480.1 iron ABC transporter permease [Amphritea sp. 2_MG-2023]